MSLPTLRRREIVAKTVSIAEALQEIPDGSRVFVGAGAGEPLALVDALLDRVQAGRLHLLFGFSLRKPPVAGRLPMCTYLHVGRRQQAELADGRIEWIPATADMIPFWFKNGRLEVDAALVQVNPGDLHGQYSLGTAVDFTKAAVDAARIVIAQVNPYVPRTHGQSFVDWRRVHRFAVREEPLPEVTGRHSDSPMEEEIARNVIRLIPDQATLQLGFSLVPRQLLSRLATKRNLGVHSLLVSDWVMELMENGNVTNAFKTFAPGKVTASCALGSRRFYEYLHDSPAFDFQPADTVAQTAAANPGFINVIDVSEVEICGRAHFGNSTHSRRLSAFLGMSPAAPGALTIAVLPARNLDGTPTIRADFSNDFAPGRRDVWPDVVVTEHGTAFLAGKTLAQRALALLSVAHPDDRGDLWDAALSRRRIAISWLPGIARAGNGVYDDDPESGLVVRTASAADFHDIVRFFDHLAPRDVAMRFFSGNAKPHEYWEKALFRENGVVLLAVKTAGGHERLFGVAECAVDAQKTGEIAMAAHPDHRRSGIGGRLAGALEKWADENAVTLHATVLPSNTPMLQLLQKRGWTGQQREDAWVFSRSPAKTA